MGKKRDRHSPSSATAAAPATAAAAAAAAEPTSTYPPDAPGEGINRRRPWLLRLVLTAYLAWLLYLGWITVS